MNIYRQVASISIRGFNISEIIKSGMSEEQNARQHKSDPKWVDPEGMNHEE